MSTHGAALLLLAGFALASSGGRPAAADARDDTLGVRFEVGARSDWTNEQFYEESFIDTTFLERRLVGTPESRVAAVLFGQLTGTSGARRGVYQIQNEVVIGDKIVRETAAGSWARSGGAWRAILAPRFEYERDRSFDRDLERLRGAGDVRLQHLWSDGERRAEMVASGEWFRTAGTGAEFLPDRNQARGRFALDHLPLFGAEWRAEYAVTSRVFPDSTERDHIEHSAHGHWRRDFDGGHSIALDVDGTRRLARRPTRDSRDRFRELDGRIEWNWRMLPSLVGASDVTFELVAYDDPDSAVFFDYQIVRASLVPRREGSGWSAGFGPRGEALRSVSNPFEQYWELAAVAPLECFFGTRSWWSIAPAGGWREYRDGEAAQSDLGIEAVPSSYRFYELSVFGDQFLAEGVRLRVLASGRLERHTRNADDARSLYFSVDVRRLF